MRVLLTGGTGFIGIYLIRRMVEEGYNPIVFDVAPNTKPIEDLLDRVKIIRGDLTVPSEIYAAMKENRVEEVFHMAALLSTACEQRPALGFKVNVEGTVNVLEAARTLGVKRVVYPSSIVVYTPIKGFVREEADKHPQSVYGITKLFGELWHEYYARRFGLDVRMVRFPSIIGPRRIDGGASVYTSHMIEKTILGEPYVAPVDPDFRLGVLYVKDAVEALMTVWQAEEAPSRVYNIGELEPAAKEIADTVKRYVPEAQISFKPDPRTMAVLANWAGMRLDYTRIKRELGWDIKYRLDEMVRDYIRELKGA
jgi:nucleoside-diphosphate-sugar epimerase